MVGTGHSACTVRHRRRRSWSTRDARKESARDRGTLPGVGRLRVVVDRDRDLGGIDILVATASISGPPLLLGEYSPEALQQVIDIELTGVFL